MADALRALDEADRARAAGAWIAGYLSYELGAAFVNEPVRASTWPLLALGIFDGPAELSPMRVPELPEAALLARIDYGVYARAIEAIRNAIYDGEVYQVNYTVPFACATGNADPFDWWRAVAATTNARYQAYVEDDTRRILSWSPELFLALDGTRVETRPMKGTATLDALDELDTAKNRAEHVMIVDLLRNDLQRVCDAVTVERLFERERYPTFATMTSTIAGELRPGTSLRELLQATFPCGSVTGAPKRAAIAHIAALESQPRDVYCGSIGFLSPEGSGWWNVGIRTAQMDLARDRTRFDAGGGIVADSDARSEWNEIHVKTAFLRSACGAFELWETLSSEATADRIERHLRRLASTASRFGAAFDIDAARTQILTLRAGEPRLIRVRLRLDGTLRLVTTPLERPSQPVRMRLSERRVCSDDPFLRVKTSHRPGHATAASEAEAHGCFDALLRNERGELTEGTRTNLFVERNGVLLTPPVECGLLPGILRGTLVSEGRAREAVLTVDDLERADAVFLGNSARGLLRATLVKDP